MNTFTPARIVFKALKCLRARTVVNRIISAAIGCNARDEAKFFLWVNFSLVGEGCLAQPAVFQPFSMLEVTHG